MIGEIIFGLIILLGSVYLFYESTQLKEFVESYKSVGSAFWPQIILFILIILIGYILIKNILGYLRERKTTPSSTPSALERLSPQFVKGGLRFLAGVGIITAYIYLLKFLGFIVASPLFIAGLMLFVNPQKKKLMPYGIIGIMIVIYVVFVKLLMIPVPRGTGFLYDLSIFLGI